MQNNINPENVRVAEGGVSAIMGKKVLIATLYKPEPVLLAATRLGPEKLILLLDKEPDKEQLDSLKLIKNSLGKVLEVVEERTEVYDVVEVARKCVKIIDEQAKDDWIFVNITSGRKTKAIGLLFAAYARHDMVKKIAYNPEEDKSAVVYLPRLSFKLTESQKTILEKLEKGHYANTTELADKLSLSTAMVYRAVGELEDMDLITCNEDGIKLTDAGKIARL
jgi:CRISPR locus-related DNA-binding protein